MSNKYKFFFRSASPFSQWHFKSFVFRANKFNCAEQFMMYMKAKLFEDQEIAKKILSSSHPRDQKKLGRKVHNFDPSVWSEHKRNIVYVGSYLKFSQNDTLLKGLLNSYPKTLVEASPYDTIWGIGLSAEDPKAQDKSTWRGQNLLGEILTELRNDFMQEKTVKKVRNILEKNKELFIENEDGYTLIDND